MAERLEGSRIIRNGGSFEKYLAATQNLKEDPLNTTLFGKYTQETYLQETGGLFENLEKYNWQTCDGYYDTIKLWFQNHGFIK